MEEILLTFDNSVERYVTIAERYIEAEKYDDALRFLFSALNKSYSSETLALIAKTYSEMGIYGLSNKYWIKFLDNSPESSYGEAYEELGINYFYMDNFFLSSYYFNKKVAVDGYLKSENLGKEIIDYFSKTIDRKNHYKLVYPFNIADFSEELGFGKSLLSHGETIKCIEVLEKIPKGAKEYYEALDIISLAEFLIGNTDRAIRINRKIMQEKGENISTCCNLSTFYTLKGDKEKSRYYYEKALTSPIIEDEMYYRLATCSLEQGEHLKAVSYLEKVLEDRPYDLKLMFLLGLANINANKYNTAKSIFLKLYSISPDNPIYSYYLDFANKLCENNMEYVNLLPLAYEDDLPKFERQKIKKRIQRYLNIELSTLKKKIKTKQFKEDVRWAFLKGNEQSVKTMAFLLVSMREERANKMALEILSDMEIQDSAKGALLFTLIVHDYSGKIGVSCGSFYNRIKLRKIGMEDEEEMGELFIGYALVMTKLAFMEIDNFDKISFSVNKVYKKFRGKKTIEEFSREELASLILFLCNYVRFKNTKDIIKLFKVKKERLDLLIGLYNGGKNDKNS